MRLPQVASLVPVKPYAQLEVAPEDFPFLRDIRGIDDDRLPEYGQAMQAGAPWRCKIKAHIGLLSVNAGYVERKSARLIVGFIGCAG